MKPKYFLYLLVPLTIFEAYAEYIHWPEGKFFSKPLLIPLIALYYYFSITGEWNFVHKVMMASFLFSWFGDVFLLLTPENIADTQLMGIPKSKYFFLCGVGSFLLTQLSFISAYRKSVSNSNLSISKFFFLPFLIYWLFMLSLVLPALYNNPEKSVATIPVALYASILVGMAAFSLSRYGKTNSRSFWFTFLGACTFVVSDCHIAFDFLVLSEPMASAGFFIMATFIPAEWMIAQGMLEHYKTSEI